MYCRIFTGHLLPRWFNQHNGRLGHRTKTAWFRGCLVARSWLSGWENQTWEVGLLSTHGIVQKNINFRDGVVMKTFGRRRLLGLVSAISAIMLGSVAVPRVDPDLHSQEQNETWDMITILASQNRPPHTTPQQPSQSPIPLDLLVFIQCHIYILGESLGVTIHPKLRTRDPCAGWSQKSQSGPMVAVTRSRVRTTVAIGERVWRR